ncbi:MAG: hypothetical protein DCF13_12840 [Flavobacteriaceae bacterium]|nr:MAG: hypothetical protein DCF13_12840 [Flavobacteriaceae bacterium]
MRTSIKILGIVALSFVTFSNASAKEVFQPQLENEHLLSAVVCNNQLEDSSVVAIEPLYFSPSNVLATYHSSIVDEIKMDNEVVQAETIEYQPLCIDRTLEDVILEDSQIIESIVSTETYTLDFEKINKNMKRFPMSENKTSLKVEEMKL